MAMGQSESDEGEEAGSMAWGLIEEEWESWGEASGIGEPIVCVLCSCVRRGGEATSVGCGGESEISLTFWCEIPRGQGEEIGRTFWMEEEWSVDGEKNGVSSKKVTSADI